MQGFLVDSVETIERLSWEDVKTPPPMVASRLGGLVTAVAELKDQRLVMIMDVEKVLAETARFYDEENLFDEVPVYEVKEVHGFFADDSSVARKQIAATLDHMQIKHTSAVNGAEAWERLQEIAARAEAAGRPATDYVQFILTDVETLEMDGYVPTQKISRMPCFDDVPVLMHSSLTADANQMLARASVPTLTYQFEPRCQSKALIEVLYDRAKGEHVYTAAASRSSPTRCAALPIARKGGSPRPTA